MPNLREVAQMRRQMPALLKQAFRPREASADDAAIASFKVVALSLELRRDAALKYEAGADALDKLVQIANDAYRTQATVRALHAWWPSFAEGNGFAPECDGKVGGIPLGIQSAS